MLTFARMFFPGLLAGALLALFALGRPAPPPPRIELAPQLPRPEPPPATGRDTVYLAGQLSDEALLSLGALAARQPNALLLLDSPTASAPLRQFLQSRPPKQLLPVGAFAGGRDALAKRLGLSIAPIRPEAHSAGHRHVIVCPPAPREQLLQAAWLAGLLRAPLCLCEDTAARRDELRRCLAAGQASRPTLVLVGGVKPADPNVETMELDDAAAVRDYGQKVLTALAGPPRVAVVANPHDARQGNLSSLAPWLAASKQALLLLTNARGTDVPALVEGLKLPSLDTVLIAASLKAIPMKQRPNPIPEDKDKAIDLEPLSPPDGQPFPYAVGRLFHDDRALVPLMLARQRLLAENAGPRRALVASNPGGSLGLLEVFSRSTARELANVGYEVRGLFGKELKARALRKAMVGPEIILWEGHHNTLIKDWEMPAWDEPLPPSVIFLQSCLALHEEKAQPLLTRGAVAVVGSSTRIYSGSGGAFALAYFNALLYDRHTLGGALRQAKNFMTCYVAMKEQRLGENAVRAGANRRAAWSFTLWGDPTFRLPAPRLPTSSLAAVRHEVIDNVLVVQLPEKAHERISTAKYQVRMPPNARLAGLVRKGGEDEAQPLVPFAFAEVRLPDAPPGCEPRLRSRLPAGDWVFQWDARRRTGHLLAVPRPGAKALRFEIDWSPTRVAARQ